MTLTDLTTPLTRAQVESSVYAVLQALGVNTTTWKPGAVVRAIITAYCYVVAAFTTWSSNAVKAGFLLLSSGDWLRAAAKYDYGTDYIPATFATGAVTVVNSAGGIYDFAPGELVCSATLSVGGATTTKYYHNTATVHVGANETVTNIAIQADEIGADSTAGAGAINALVPGYPGLSVSNPLAVVGTDDETDASLTARALQAASAVSPAGPADAYRYVALSTLSPTSGAPVANRVSVIAGNPVQVYVLGPSGAVTGSLGDPTTDLGAIEKALLVKVLPLGVGLTLASGTTYTLTFSYTLSIYQSAYSDAELNSKVQAALGRFVAATPIGGNPPSGLVYLDALKATIVEAVPGCFHCTVSLGSDIPLATGQGLVLGTVTQTSVTRYTA